MKTFQTKFLVGETHIDEGNHANLLSQLAIAQELHFRFREELGMGLKSLRDEHGLFLVMGTVKDVTYRKQLRLDDSLNVQITVWVASLTRLEFKCIFKKDGEVATEMSWVMPLVSVTTERPAKIPGWMKNAIEEPVSAT